MRSEECLFRGSMTKRLWELAPDRLPDVQPRLAMFDVDGTLRGRDGEISPAVRRAIRALQERGCRVGLATGRPLFSAAKLIASLGLDAPSILMSGALMVAPDLTPLAANPLKADEVRAIVLGCRALGIDFELYSDDRYFAERESELLRVHWSYYDAPAERIADLVSLVEAFPGVSRVVKAHLILEESAEAEALERLRPLLPGLRFSVAHGAAHPELSFVNVTSAAAQPAEMLERIAVGLDLPLSAVVAFGDGASDIPVLRRAGLGIAMANAKPVVHEAADFITKSVDEDGVSYAVELLLRPIKS